MNNVKVILLVEDSPDDVFFFRRALAKSGAQATLYVAEDGVEAMNYIANQGRFADRQMFPPPEIVFLDLKLPHMNGFEFLQWFRQNRPNSPIPIVVLSSSDETKDRERARILGVAAFHLKPPTPEQLSALISGSPLPAQV